MTIYQRLSQWFVVALSLCSALLPFAASAHNPAILPADRLSESWWAERHDAILAKLRYERDAQVLLIGDSITNNYDKADPPDENFRPTWLQFYAPRRALNLGFSGDTTANVLWRLQNGEVDGLSPKVAVVLIGTNNTNGARHSAEQTKSGIDAVVAELERRLPRTRILLLGILPSGISPEKTATDQAVNAALAATYAINPRVTYLDIGSIFHRNGVLDAKLFYDPRLKRPGKPLHPDTIGQRMMAEAIEPTLARLMDEGPRAPLESMTSFNTALIPVPALEQDSYDWYARHHAVLYAKTQIKPELVLIGDSITHFWGGIPAANHVNGPSSWERAFGKMQTLNLGFGWDRTQNVLWRLRQGELDELAPRWIVLNIGTNNFVSTSNARANTPEETVEAIAAIRDELHRRSPNSRILLMSIFPRGASPSDPIRKPIAATNRLLAHRFADDPVVEMIDLTPQFLAPDGSIPADLMPDQVHPSERGYAIWADALIKEGVTMRESSVDEASRMRSVDALMASYSGDVPGASLLVLRNGRPLVLKSYGLANLEARVSATPSTNYRLASVTKQFTAGAVLLLAQQGKLELDDPVRAWLPSLPAVAQGMTVRHLLSHMSGILDYEDFIPASFDGQLHDADVLKVLESQETTYFTPGTSYRYSNSGYALLALIVAKASGQDFATFLRERIFVPLGMTNTVAFEEGVSSVSQRAYGYSETKGGWERTDQSQTSAVLGDGGIYSSVTDLAKWDAVLYGDRLFNAESRALLFTPLTATDDPKIRYAMGWRITEEEIGGTTQWHSGETIGFRNVLIRYPQQRMTVILLTNRNDPEPYRLAREIARLYLTR